MFKFCKKFCFYRLGYAIFLVAIFAGNSHLAASTKPPIRITADSGGMIIDYALRIKEAENSGRKIEFKGRCDSACTLFLGLSPTKACISPKASFGFHLPYGNSPEQNAKAASYLMTRYPTWVARWIKANGGLKNTMMRMNYGYARKHIKAC